MPRHPIAIALADPLPQPPDSPHPTPSPLQNHISSTLTNTDYDSVSIPLTNKNWQDRWERLCLRPVEDEDDQHDDQGQREAVDREADIWRKEGGLRREEVNVSRLEESQHLVGVAAEWLELDSPDEGIRFDSELVSLFDEPLTDRLKNKSGITIRICLCPIPLATRRHHPRAQTHQQSLPAVIRPRHLQPPLIRRCFLLHPNLSPDTRLRPSRTHWSRPRAHKR